MEKFNAIMLSIVYTIGDQRIEVKRVVYVPQACTCLSTKELIKEVRNLLEVDGGNSYIIAYKYGNIKNKVITNHPYVLIDKTEFENLSDWYIDNIFDTFELHTIDKLADPIILLYGYDKRTLKYKLTYYVDLISKGFSEENALSEILS